MLEDGIMHFMDYGVYNLGGPNWKKKNRQIIQDNFDDEIFAWADLYSGPNAMSTQTIQHWSQNEIVDRYQEFAPNWN